MCMKKISDCLYKTVNIIMALIFTWLLILLCIGSKIDYAYKIDWKIENIILLILGMGCLYLIKKIPFKSIESLLKNRKFVLGFAFIFFLVQVYVFYCIFFETGWDSGGAVIPAARALLEKADVTDLNERYFKVYPNNLFLVHLYYLILKICTRVGVFCGTYQLMPIVICNCAISSVSCLMLFFIGEKRVPIKWTWTIYIWMLFVVGLSPWNVICYSDPLALFFPICIVYLYLNVDMNIYIKYGIILILGYIGYCIKPQVVIVIIALTITEILRYMKMKPKMKVRKMIGTIVVSGVIICLISSGLHFVYQQNGFVKEKDREFGMSHFFMMGLNEKTGGGWLNEDVQTSENCKTSQERQRNNIKIAKERLKAFGAAGYFKFLSKKMLTNYNDGTFAWGAEGQFYYVVPENPSARLTYQFREIYYHSGAYYDYFSMTEQFLWITMLGMVWWIAVKQIFEKNGQQYFILLLELSLIGITLFELLFEARARYLYLYVPIYAVFVLLGNRKEQKHCNIA